MKYTERFCIMQGLTALHIAVCSDAPPASNGLEGRLAWWVRRLITHALVAVKLSQSFQPLRLA